MYRNVPMGTEESKMTRPTLDHFPNGSRFTPLLIKALKIGKKTHQCKKIKKKCSIDLNLLNK